MTLSVQVRTGRSVRGMIARVLAPADVELLCADAALRHGCPAGSGTDVVRFLANALDRPRRVLRPDRGGPTVWHVTVRRHRLLTRWSRPCWVAVVAAVVESMDLDGVAGSAAPARWLATAPARGPILRVDLVASLVREDGSRVDRWQDWRRVRAAVSTPMASDASDHVS